MRGKRTFLGVILLIALSAMLVAGATSAADPGQQRAPGDLIDRLFGMQIVGTWEATVNRGPVLPPLTSLHTITSDHTLVESGSDSLFRSPSYRRVGVRRQPHLRDDDGVPPLQLGWRPHRLDEGEREPARVGGWRNVRRRGGEPGA